MAEGFEMATHSRRRMMEVAGEPESALEACAKR
jgi:hypothetical protein